MAESKDTSDAKVLEEIGSELNPNKLSRETTDETGKEVLMAVDGTNITEAIDPETLAGTKPDTVDDPDNDDAVKFKLDDINGTKDDGTGDIISVAPTLKLLGTAHRVPKEELTKDTANTNPDEGPTDKDPEPALRAPSK
ncbi:MAG: hypothetical protein N4Q30_07945 [Neisseriaceae bacterium]|nr:hypothetical protein [Neisseriaceae bacterium]